MSTKRMLIDASYPEETRVVVLDGNRLEDYAVEIASRQQIKGNIYLAKVTRVEPSLQAAFVDYGGNRHGFLAFNEIHPDYYQIPVADREALLAEQAAAARAEDSNDVDLTNGDSRDSGDGEETDAMSRANLTDGETSTDESDGVSEPQSVDARDADGESDAETVLESNGEPADAADAQETSESADDDDELDTPRVRTPVRYYKIQEVIKRRQIMLVQVVKEERGNKGAALTTYLSLAGRYCVLMPNTSRGGGISRKINTATDRKRLKRVLSDLEIPEGMAVIVRTAGAGRSKAEIKRDYEYLMRLWNNIREKTLESSAPMLIHEEGNLIKRSIRDLYGREVEEIIVRGENEYRTAKEFMKLLIPSHAKRVKLDDGSELPLFQRFPVESQLHAMHKPVVQLKSGGYLVINPTEALVSIDVNSGRATRERHIEETALRTNLEAADEVARQLRLRDLAGLIVIDFIDMENTRNQSQVERRLKEAMKNDRARVQLGRISPFGLLELSRQRLRPSLLETSFEVCQHCSGSGMRRTLSSMALAILRRIEEEGLSGRTAEVQVFAPAAVAMHLLNAKRGALAEMEKRYAFGISITIEDPTQGGEFRIERVARSGDVAETAAIERHRADESTAAESVSTDTGDEGERDDPTKRPRRRRPKRRRRPEEETAIAAEPASLNADETSDEERGEGDDEPESGDDSARSKRRRRGKRGGRRRNRKPAEGDGISLVDGSETNGENEPQTVTDESTDDKDHGIAAETTDQQGEENAPMETSAATSSGEPAPEPVRRGQRSRRRRAEEEAGPPPAVENIVESTNVSVSGEGDGRSIYEVADAPAPSVSLDPTPPFDQEPERVSDDGDDTLKREDGGEPVHQDTRGGNGGDQPTVSPPAGNTGQTEVIEVGAQDEDRDRPRKGWWQRLIE